MAVELSLRQPDFIKGMIHMWSCYKHVTFAEQLVFFCLPLITRFNDHSKAFDIVRVKFYSSDKSPCQLIRSHPVTTYCTCWKLIPPQTRNFNNSRADRVNCVRGKLPCVHIDCPDSGPGVYYLFLCFWYLFLISDLCLATDPTSQLLTLNYSNSACLHITADSSVAWQVSGPC